MLERHGRAGYIIPKKATAGNMNMEFRVLKYFLSVARTGSITAAAHTLHVTQPTLSRQLQDLEYELGKKLFVRGSHHVSLTRDGMLFRQRAEEIMEIVAQTEAEFHTGSRTLAGDVHIGGGESAALSPLAEIIGGFREDFPQVRFHLYSGNSEDVTARLEHGILDFGILIQPVDISRYDNLPLPIGDIWGLALRRDHPLAKRKTIRPCDLADIPLLLSRQIFHNEKLNDPVASWLGEWGEHIDVAGTYNLIFNAALLVRAGVGCALTLDNLINATSQSDLCFRPLTPKLEAGLAIVWKKNRIFSDAAEKFLERMKENFSAGK